MHSQSGALHHDAAKRAESQDKLAPELAPHSEVGLFGITCDMAIYHQLNSTSASGSTPNSVKPSDDSNAARSRSILPAGLDDLFVCLFV